MTITIYIMKGILSNIAAYLCLGLALAALYAFIFEGMIFHSLTASVLFFCYIGFRESAEEDKEQEKEDW